MQTNVLESLFTVAPSRSIARKLAVRMGLAPSVLPACDTGCASGADGANDDCSYH